MFPQDFFLYAYAVQYAEQGDENEQGQSYPVVHEDAQAEVVEQKARIGGVADVLVKPIGF